MIKDDCKSSAAAEVVLAALLGRERLVLVPVPRSKIEWPLKFLSLEFFNAFLGFLLRRNRMLRHAIGGALMLFSLQQFVAPAST